jgi:hypothetical protein
VDCSQDGIQPKDVLDLLKHAGGIEVSQSGIDSCPALGSQVAIDGIPRGWGNLNCSVSGSGDQIDGRDALRDLLFLALLNPSQVSECPELNEDVSVGLAGS